MNKSNLLIGLRMRIGAESPYARLLFRFQLNYLNYNFHYKVLKTRFKLAELGQ